MKGQIEVNRILWIMATAGSHGDSIHQQVVFKRAYLTVTNETRKQSYGIVILGMMCLWEIGRGSFMTSNDMYME